MSNLQPTLIYLDTNVYSRPFDDQAQPTIQDEANAYLAIIAAVKTGKLELFSSDILAFEVARILSPDKRAKTEQALTLCNRHVGQSEDVLNLGRMIENRCGIRA